MTKLAYIGLTGVKTRQESFALREMMRRVGLPPTHRLMVGGLASYKGLVWGEVADPCQYPHPASLAGLFVNDNRLLNTVHYNSRAKGLVCQIQDVLNLAGPNVQAIQLNIPWPDPELLRRLRERHYVEIILQVSKEASSCLDHVPARIAMKLAQYEGLVEYVLFDPSGGVGSPFSLEYIVPVVTAAVRSRLDMGWGVAGGLGPGRLNILEPLLDIYPQLSWDAQARLRSSDGQALDLAACEQYLREGVALLHKLPGRDSTCT